VLLTDGEPASSTLFTILRSHVEANRHLLPKPDDCPVECRHLLWSAAAVENLLGGDASAEAKAGQVNPSVASGAAMGPVPMSASSSQAKASVVEEASPSWVIGSDITYKGIDHEALLSAVFALLTMGTHTGTTSSPPRVVFSHEHRTRDLGLLRAPLEDWLEGDQVFSQFVESAERWGLSAVPLLWERTATGDVRGQFCHWGYDVSVFELRLALVPTTIS